MLKHVIIYFQIFKHAIFDELAKSNLSFCSDSDIDFCSARKLMRRNNKKKEKNLDLEYIIEEMYLTVEMFKFQSVLDPANKCMFIQN